MLHAKLLRGYAFVSAEAFYHVAAVGKSRFLAYIAEIKIGVKKELLRLHDPYAFNVFLAGLSVDFKEFFCEIRIAHSAFTGDIGYLYPIAHVLVYVFGDAVNIVSHIIGICIAVNGKALFLPASYNADEQP